MNSLVSIIVPVYNAAKYLSRCLNSVVNQTYSNLEIILINDGSTDSSLDICKKYAKEDKRVILVNKNNEGVSIARNEGMQKSSGEYIAFLDADDWITPNYIEQLMIPFSNENVDISICEYQICKEFTSPSIELSPSRNYEKARKFLLNCQKNGDFATIVPWGKIFNAKIVAGIFFPPKLHFEDEATIYKFFYAANQIAKSDYKAYYYFQSSDGLTKSVYPKYPEDAIKVFELQYTFFKERNDYVFFQQILATLLWKCLNLYVVRKDKRNTAKEKINQYLKDFKRFNTNYNHSISLIFFCHFPFIYLLYKKSFKHLYELYYCFYSHL